MGSRERRFESVYPDVLKKLFLSVVVVGAVSGCSMPQQSPPRPSPPMEVRSQNVQVYCDTVEKTGGKHDVMKKQEGHLNDEIGYAGIPNPVILAHREYFKGFESESTVELGKQYVKIIEACRAAGWQMSVERT